MRLLAVLVAFGVLACSATTRLTARVDDYQLYRATRLASTLEQRLAAANQYLNRMPQGAFRAEIEHWFVPQEKKYFRGAWKSLPRLRAYLGAMPDGPNADAVAERIVELELEQQFAKRRDERELEAARRVTDALDSAAAARRHFLREFSRWVDALVSIKTFGQPTSELDHDFIYRFRLSEPAGKCSEDRCRKMLSFTFKVPSEKVLLEREAIAEVELALTGDGLAGASLAGPGLFSRLDEAIELRAVAPDNAQARAEAMARAAQLVARAVEAELPAKECERQPISPVILWRACRGLEIIVSAGTTLEEDDRVEVRPQVQ